MEILGEEEQERVRISIGKTEKGLKGMKKPIKSMTILGANVKEIYFLIKETIKKTRKVKN